MTEHPDNRMNNAARKATAVMLALSALAVFTPGATAIEVTGSCTKSEDDAGFGGTTVSCTLPCGATALLAIGAVATDTGATVAGHYNCGGQGAPCTGLGPICKGQSPGLTTREDEGKDACYAESDEFWSSPVTVWCLIIGGTGDNQVDPEELICEKYPDFPECDDAAPTEPLPDPKDLVPDPCRDDESCVPTPDPCPDAEGCAPDPCRDDESCVPDPGEPPGFPSCPSLAAVHGITLPDEVWAGLFPDFLAGVEGITSMLSFVTYPDGSILAFLVTPDEPEESSGAIGLPKLPTACEIIEKAGPMFN